MFRDGQRSAFPIRNIKHPLLLPKHNVFINILIGKTCLLLEGRNANVLFQAGVLKWNENFHFGLFSVFPRGTPSFSHRNSSLPFKWFLLWKKPNFSLGMVVTGSVSKKTKHFWDSGRKCHVPLCVPLPPLLHKQQRKTYRKTQRAVHVLGWDSCKQWQSEPWITGLYFSRNSKPDATQIKSGWCFPAPAAEEESSVNT